MFRILKVFGLSVVSAGVCLISSVADAATGRAAYDNVRTGSFAGATQGSATARMPSMPTLPLISVGNISTNVPLTPTDNGGSDTPNDPSVNPDNPRPDRCWDGVPHAIAGYRLETGACEITECEHGWKVHESKRYCVEISNCPDGGVKDSEYTIDDCMRDVLACINNGALPNGLNDMFNADLRASIINGMGLCYNQIDRCITDVRRNCENVYGSRADVWIDFNSRIVQPEYYSFVLRKTGLTPLQAENTCLLLDKNTYGKSFAAVNASDNVTGEYNQSIGAYNNQMDGNLRKDNPMGATINTDGYVDAKRGHYARWDASKAECLIRVAAYNKDKHITNKWLGIGDDRPAEVWKIAGETFTCNKELFGFSLMNDTKSAALIGVTGGTLLGAGIGAGVGAGIADKNASAGEGCKNEVFRKNLLKSLQKSTNMEVLSRFLSAPVHKASHEMSETVCEEILRLPDVYKDYDMLVSLCEKGNMQNLDVYSVACEGGTVMECLRQQIKALGKIAEADIDATLSQLSPCVTTIDAAKGQYVIRAEGTCGQLMTLAGFVAKQMGECMFKNPDKQAQKMTDEDVLCFGSGECIPYDETREKLNMMATVLPNIKNVELPEEVESRGATIAKSAAIGGVIGAGAGGVATAITALVEHDNINCRVGDGLGQVGLNKSYSIDGLKDLYVKWNLNLPDTQVLGGGTTVNDLSSWKSSCKTYVSASACGSAQFYYKNAVGALEWVYSACEWDSVKAECNPNPVLIKSYDVK